MALNSHRGVPPRPNLNFAFAASAPAAGRPCRWRRTLWHPNHLKLAAFAAAPVSRMATLSSPGGRKMRKLAHEDRRGAFDRDVASVRRRRRVRLGDNGFVRRDGQVGRSGGPTRRGQGGSLPRTHAGPIGSTRQKAVLGGAKVRSIPLARPRVDTVHFPIAPLCGLPLFFSLFPLRNFFRALR